MASSQPLELSFPFPEHDRHYSEAVIRLHPRDQVGLAKRNLHAGMNLLDESGSTMLTVRRFIPSGHKIALLDIAQHDLVHRYGQVIGIATQPIQAGDHVHTQNLGLPGADARVRFESEQQPVPVSEQAERVFMGYVRPDGRVGARNYIAVISTVNCSATVCEKIAHHFSSGYLDSYSNIDGVIAFTHHSGCSIRSGGPGYVWLQRTLSGIANHPNVGAFLLVGLGCEVNQIDELVKAYGLEDQKRPARYLSIQALGGIRKTVEVGIAAIEDFLPLVNVARRTEQPLSGLALALQCGGSDGWSGVTANPLVGLVADEIVKQGGKVVLGETPEIYGAEHLLTRRATSNAVAKKLLERIKWWEEHTRLFGTEMDNNPTPGNKAGGLTNIVEKALGAVAKGGSSPLTGVYEYAETVVAQGLTFMDTPGNDPVSVTGQVAGGCNLVLFTTGRGSVFGFKPSPSIKIATNSTLYKHMTEDMDFDAGRVVDGADAADLADELLDLIIAVASGKPSKSEAQGVGEREFSPWHYGETV